SSATVTHVSDGEVKATADRLLIVNELGEDVTDKLNITYVDGTISIVPRRLAVFTSSGTKIYDGTPLAAVKGAKLEGLVPGETAKLVATGSQTDAGSSSNTYQIQWGTANADDYQVSESLGTLTVTASGSDNAVKDSQTASTIASNGSSAARGAAQAGGTPNTGDNTAVMAIAGIAVAGAALIALALRLRLKKSKR
ncbi:MAG: MBG domain-containing protein, partial [Parafannyhessea sp.]|uniref:MBG domain-containing protein n=1 Tax=Parafannyhessea sp. TaxID=2847324 RepID=UPI003F00FADA